MIDHKAIALTAARARWGIDNTWNVTYVYYQVDQEIFVLIDKYTDETYATIDSSAGQQYAVKLDPARYTVTGGLIINL